MKKCIWTLKISTKLSTREEENYLHIGARYKGEYLLTNLRKYRYIYKYYSIHLVLSHTCHKYLFIIIMCYISK